MSSGPACNATSCSPWLWRASTARYGATEVRGWEGLEGTYGLPDRDDEHVVAAAVVGGAGTVELDPLGALRAVHMMAARSGRRGAVRSADDVLAVLAGRYGLTRAVETIRQATA